MDIQERLSLSYYKEIAVLNESHEIFLVQHQQTQKIFVKKILHIYNRNIYTYLKDHPIPHTPKIYDIFEYENKLTVIEEYISGDTLEALLEQGVSFTGREIRDIMLQLCDILIDLHNCEPPIIHRDIKPSNVMKTPSGEIILLDLNAAKYQSFDKTEDTSLLGTKGYAAPEQYGFGVSNVQTDIYALGMLMNTLISGGFSAAVCKNNLFSPIIQKCVRLKPAERYKDVLSVKKALQNILPCKNPSKTPNGWKRFLPPGFRTMNPVYMLISSVGYLMIFWLSLTLEVKDITPGKLMVERIFVLIIFLSIVLCSCNYLDLQKFFPPCRTRNKPLKILAVVLLDFIVAMSIFIIMVFVLEIIS